MKHKYLFFSILALTIAGVFLAAAVMDYFTYNLNKSCVYYGLGFLGSLLSGINLLSAYKQNICKKEL